MIQKLKSLMQNQSLRQFIRFGIIGVSNTAVSYGVEMLGKYVLLSDSGLSENAQVVLVSAASFIVSTVHSYIWNNRFVFRPDQKPTMKQHLIRYWRMARCYAITGLILSPLMKMGLGALGVPFWAASLMTLIVTVPVNFLLNKFWAFGEKASRNT